LHLPSVEPVELLSHLVWAGQVQCRWGCRFLNGDQAGSQQGKHSRSSAAFSLVAGDVVLEALSNQIASAQSTPAWRIEGTKAFLSTVAQLSTACGSVKTFLRKLPADQSIMTAKGNDSHVLDERVSASTSTNPMEGIGSRFPHLFLSSRIWGEQRSTDRKRCIRRPTYGIHRSPRENLPKKRFPKSPLLGNDSCMRRELNAAQPPLTMSNFAQSSKIGPSLGCFGG